MYWTENKGIMMVCFIMLYLVCLYAYAYVYIYVYAVKINTFFYI